MSKDQAQAWDAFLTILFVMLVWFTVAMSLLRLGKSYEMELKQPCTEAR